ncbi:MAG: hypothetical protein R3B93_08440 [Bacteroidia bacterium]
MTLQEILEYENYKVELAADGAKVFKCLPRKNYDVRYYATSKCPR